MSIILITDHNENITNIEGDAKRTFLYEEATTKLKALKQHKIVTAPIKCLVKAHATMGVPDGHLIPDPCEYLKKRTGHVAYTAQLDSKEKHICHPKQKLFPSPEQIAEYNKYKKNQAVTSQNFLRKNIKTAVNLKAKEPEPRIAVDHHGKTKRLSDSLEPIYIKSSSFGKTPKYLKQFIKKRQQLYQMQKDAIGVEKPKCRYIRKDEREELLMGLKHNWEELQKQYQGLPILTDTIPKMIRKSKLEAELKQLEKDIVLVERHPYIYIYDNVSNFPN